MGRVRTIIGSLALLFATALAPAPAVFAAGAADVMELTDDPGNWFRSRSTGTPVSVVDPGDRVDFVINGCCTNTRHTVTLLFRPVGSNLVLDQDESKNGTLSATFDVPGV